MESYESRVKVAGESCDSRIAQPSQGGNHDTASHRKLPSQAARRPVPARRPGVTGSGPARRDWLRSPRVRMKARLGDAVTSLGHHHGHGAACTVTVLSLRATQPEWQHVTRRLGLRLRVRRMPGPVGLRLGSLSGKLRPQAQALEFEWSS